MNNKKSLILLIIVLNIKINCQQYFHSVSCPHIFSYVLNSQTGLIEGRIKIIDTRPGLNIVSIKMTYSSQIGLSRYHGSISLIQNNRQVAREVYYHYPIIYRVSFPTVNVIPIIREIISNGRLVCNNQVPRYGVRHITLTHKLNVPSVTHLAVTSESRKNFRRPISVHGRRPQTTTSVISNSSPSECGTTVYPVNLIYGGKRSQPGSWPWLVPIFIRNQRGGYKYVCGGTIVSTHAIITAAHCIVEEGRLYRPQDVLIGLGINNIYNWNEPHTHIARVSRIISHPEYSIKSIYDADIAIIFLDKSYSYNHLIRPACIWSGSTDLNSVINRVGNVAGWGQARIGGDTEAEPNIISTQIVSGEKCLRSNEAFTSITTERNFCAGYRNGNGPCKGDSGSGLIMDLGGRWYLRGLVSGSLRHTITTCDLKEYAVYTDIAKFLDWIRLYIR